MGFEMQPGVMRAQKHEIQISHVKKNLIFSVKKIYFQCGTGSLFCNYSANLFLNLL
jgi:hypothetical protein